MAPQDSSYTALLRCVDQPDLGQPGATLELRWNTFSANMGNLDEEESRYVLSIAKLTLGHARNLQWIIDTFQLDAASFVAKYELKDKPEAQMVVNAMVAGYIEIYENLSNRLSPVVFGKHPNELVQLKEWLSSNNLLTEQRKLRNSCAHEANVKLPLAGTTTESSSVFMPRVFFEHLEASIRPLIVELATLVAIMEHTPNNHQERTEASSDRELTATQQQVLYLLAEKQDPQLKNLNKLLNQAENLSAACDFLKKKVDSREWNVQQQTAFVFNLVFRKLKDQYTDSIHELRQKIYQRTAKAVEFYRGDALVGATSDTGSLGPDLADPDLPDPDFDWGVSAAIDDWSSDGWGQVTVTEDPDASLTPMEVLYIYLRRASRQPGPDTFQLPYVFLHRYTRSVTHHRRLVVTSGGRFVRRLTALKTVWRTKRRFD